MKKAAIVVAAVWLVTTLLWIQPGVVRPDGAGYLVYLPSVHLDRDLVFFDEWQELGMVRDGAIFHKEISPTNHLANHWTVGSALVWWPAFAIADLLRGDAPRNGLALPYNLAIVLTSALAGLVTLLAGMRGARVEPRYAAIAAIATWLGTPLIWYALVHATMAHALSAAACALVFAGAVRLREQRDNAIAFLTGLAAGLAFSIRPQNAPVAAVPFVLDIRTPPLPFAAGLALGALPQLVVSQFIYGSPLAFLGGGSTKPFAAFQRVRLIESLFSWYHGMFPWTPLAAIALVGLYFLWKRDRRLAAACLLLFVSQWLINGLLDRTFWGGVSFGQRRFDNCTVVFLIGTAAFLERTRRLGIVLVAAASFWTLTLVFAARNGLELSRYVGPIDLLVAQITALREVFTQFVPLGAVPPRMRFGVILFLGAFALFFALLTILFAKLPRRVTAIVAASYFVLASLVLAWCGNNGQRNLEQYRALIDRNRAFGAFPAGRDFRVTLLREELEWLMATGREDEARRTAEELRQRMAR